MLTSAVWSTVFPGARQKYLPPYLREPPPAPEPQQAAPASVPRQQGQVRAIRSAPPR